MKKLALSILVAGLCLTANAQEFKFDKLIHDFGTVVKEDGKVSYKFFFTNVGEMPLMIFKVETNCGCTAPEWTKTPVPPGQRGYITVTYDPSDGVGEFSKNIIINSNADPAFKLSIKGLVKNKS